MRVKIVSNYFSEEIKQIALKVINIDEDKIATVEHDGMEFVLLKEEYVVVG